MPTTAKGLYYPDEATNITPLHTVLGAMQTSTDNALTGRGTWFATTTDRDTAIPSPTAGTTAITGTGGSLTYWIYDGTTWKDKLPHTHPASDVVSGTLDLARIPTMDLAHIPVLDLTKIPTMDAAHLPRAHVVDRKVTDSLTGPAVTTLQSASFTVATRQVAQVAYPRVILVMLQVSGSVSSGGDWRMRLGWDTASGGTGDPTNAIAEYEMSNTGATTPRQTAGLTGFFALPANTDAWVRCWAARAAGDFTPLDIYGSSLQILALESL